MMTAHHALARNDGSTIKKSGTELYNGFVVPYNPGLLRRYQLHINVEWCNQLGSIKYLFKYINKGPDRVTAAVEDVEVDEIKEHYHYRYLSTCEAAWRIYIFDIHYRFPPIERLPFHLKGGQSAIFDATDSVDYALDNASVNETKFISWMETYKTDEEARKLLYHEFPTYYLWKQEERIWLKRQKDACQARGLWEDDKEYIDGLLEASLCGMSWLEIVYEKTWEMLFVDVLHVERAKHKNPGYGGTGKTYLYKTLSAALRSKDSKLAELIRMAKLIKWDEAPMTHKHCYEAFDRTLKDICRTDPTTPNDKGKVQITLKKEIQDFADRILSIGNGTIGGKNDGETTIEFSDDILMPDSSDHIGSLIEETYP
nr:hypothetical protein [Tanacetum cinerariifolium]